MQRRLKKLHDLAQISLDVEKAKLKTIAHKEQQRRKEINDLTASGVDRIDQLSAKDGFDLALFSGIDQRWELWKQRKISSLNTQRAALLAQMDEQRTITINAFGKEQSTRKLLEKLANEAHIKSRRV